jgi:hypothetical protein
MAFYSQEHFFSFVITSFSLCFLFASPVFSGPSTRLPQYVPMMSLVHLPLHLALEKSCLISNYEVCSFQCWNPLSCGGSFFEETIRFVK